MGEIRTKWDKRNSMGDSVKYNGAHAICRAAALEGRIRLSTLQLQLRHPQYLRPDVLPNPLPLILPILPTLGRALLAHALGLPIDIDELFKILQRLPRIPEKIALDHDREPEALEHVFARVLAVVVAIFVGEVRVGGGFGEEFPAFPVGVFEERDAERDILARELGIGIGPLDYIVIVFFLPAPEIEIPLGIFESTYIEPWLT